MQTDRKKTTPPEHRTPFDRFRRLLTHIVTVPPKKLGDAKKKSRDS